MDVLAANAELRDLAARAAGRDPDAWEALYRHSYGPLFAYARRRLLSDSEADDAVSETMTRALRRIVDFRWSGGGIEAWLYGILRNVVLETQRRRSRTRPEPPVEDAELAANDAEPLHAVLEHEQVLAVRQAFGTLSAADQEILELRVIAGMSADAVAQTIGKRAGAVRMAQSRALDRLRVALTEVTGVG